jgi:hypothetical protein
MTTDNYILEKSIWTEKDFDVMGWHDNAIHSFAFRRKDDQATGDILFDIDYIFKWVTQKEKDQIFFWVAPCTLIFHSTYDLDINIKTYDFGVDVQEINSLKLTNKTPDKVGGYIFSWTIDLLVGHIKFKSSGFTQTVRAKPVCTSDQWLSLDKRGGVSFDTHELTS